MPRFVPFMLGMEREGSSNKEVEEPVMWLWGWWRLVFWSSGGRFRVGGLLEEESGVRAGIACSVGGSEVEPKFSIGKSQSPFPVGAWSHGCKFPPGVKAESKEVMSKP